MTSWDRWTVSARLYGALGLGAVVVLGALGMGYAQMRRGEALLSAITQTEYQHMQQVHDWQLVATGTTVRIMLPQGVTAEGLATSQDSGWSSNGMQELHGIRILVVEDDQEAADLLVLILQERGATVSMAGDYDTALAALGAQSHDLLVSDIGLPGKDGYELIRHVRAAPGAYARIPAIALTAFGREADRQLAMDAGFDFHLAKPLQPQKLLDAIKCVMAKAPRPAQP